MPKTNRMAFRACKNALTGLGEAVKALSADITTRHPEVDWKGLAGLRDIVTHHYFDHDQSILYQIVCDDLPPLLGAVEELIRQIEDGPASTALAVLPHLSGKSCTCPCAM
jgi:uncharacterized protein with HEPN domain